MGNAYVVVRPGTWTEPRPDDVDVSALCELRWYAFVKYLKAGPGHTKKVWLGGDQGPHSYVGPILCKNAKVPTKLPG